MSTASRVGQRRVLVTGGNGFLGRHVVSALGRHGYRDVLTPRRADYDLTVEADVSRLFDDLAPQIVIHLLPVNLYGPHDNFNPASSHVIPALIRKCLEAIDLGSPEIVCWGTGNATREFLYVEDCAEAIVLALERYDRPEPVNIGAGFEISIRALAALIVELAGFSGRLVFDPTKPDGQPRRSLDTSRARDEFGFCATTDFREGLRRTIDWYRTQKSASV